MRIRLGARPVALGGVLGLLVACELPEEPEQPTVEILYLLDRVDGQPPPAPICEQGAVDQMLRLESIALAEDGSYARFQETQLDDDPPIQQQETGTFERTGDLIALRNGAGGVVTLEVLDSTGAFAERTHPCGNSLRYASAPVDEQAAD